MLSVMASAPAKVILTGEHFVVYGEPAIVMAINRLVHVSVEEASSDAITISSTLGVAGSFKPAGFLHLVGDLETEKILNPIYIAAKSVLSFLGKRCGLNIKVDSQIPSSVGLGSSGAVAVATVAAVGALFKADLSKEEIVRLPYEAEKYVHVKPSGIDQMICTYGGVIMYSKDKAISRLSVKTDIPLVIGNTGMQRITGNLVSAVKAKRDTFPMLMDQIIKSGGRVSVEAAESLQNGDLNRLGELMNINHGLLSAIGVSTESLDRLVNAARNAQALGAKLTGAGGGGCMIALSSPGNEDVIASAINKAGGTPLKAKKIDDGVKAWVTK